MYTKPKIVNSLNSIKMSIYQMGDPMFRITILRILDGSIGKMFRKRTLKTLIDPLPTMSLLFQLLKL